MAKLITYFQEVKSEMGRVSWPTKKQTAQYTLAVVLMSVAIAAYLGSLDSIFGWILNKVLLR
jgi:preprotein translocase subunit SecE